MVRIGVVLALGLGLAVSARAEGPVKYEPPAGRWATSQAAGGVTLFTAQGKRSRARIALHPPEPAPDGAATFARDLAQAPSPDFVDRSEVQTFTSPDGRAVVAVDGKSNTAAHAPGRQCWVFDHGQRVLAQYVAGDAAEFKKHEAAFMGFVASIHFAGAEPAGSVAQAAPGHSPVDATLRFQVPRGWRRSDVANAVWLAAPVGPDHLASYILLTPAEPLRGDFAAWYARRISPGPGVAIEQRGPVDHRKASDAYETLRQRLSLLVRGREHHEQDVMAVRSGGAAVLVALDAPTPAALQAREPEFEALLAHLAIAPGVASGAAPVSRPPPAQPGAFPQLALPAGWTLTSQTPAWRTYSAPGSSASGYAVILVAQVTRGADPYRALAATRQGLGLTAPRAPETVPLADGRRVVRASDPQSGAVPATQTVVVNRGDRAVVLILRANRADLLAAGQPVFDRAVGALEL